MDSLGLTGHWIDSQLFDQQLLLYIEDKNVAHTHVGVSFDIVKGLPSNRQLLADPQFNVDPFVASVTADVREANSLVELFEAMAAELGVDYEPGMFVKSSLPHFSPEHQGDESKPVLYAYRRSEMVGLSLLPSKMALAPDLEAAMEQLPESFEAEEADKNLWVSFFDRFGTHWTDAAFVGSKLSVSVRCDSRDALETTHSSLEAALSEVTGPWTAEGAQDRIVSQGGNPQLLPKSLNSLGRGQWADWDRSVRQRPAIIRYRLRHLADLAGGSVGRRVALKQAANWYLERFYTQWRDKHFEDKHATLAEEHAAHLEGSLETLQERHNEIHAAIVELEERLDATRHCDQRRTKASERQNRCVAERKAYQRSVVQCATRGFEMDEAEEKTKKCELELLACKLPSQLAKVKAQQGSEKPTTTTTRRERKPYEKEEIIPHVESRSSIPAKDPLYDEPPLLIRFTGMTLVFGLAAGLIWCILKRS